MKRIFFRVPAVMGITVSTSGSAAEVAAKDRWRDGIWEPEMQRLLDTGHDDDGRLFGGLEILDQFAVFNKSGSRHGNISEPLLFRFAN